MPLVSEQGGTWILGKQYPRLFSPSGFAALSTAKYQAMGMEKKSATENNWKWRFAYFRYAFCYWIILFNCWSTWIIGTHSSAPCIPVYLHMNGDAVFIIFTVLYVIELGVEKDFWYFSWRAKYARWPYLGIFLLMYFRQKCLVHILPLCNFAKLQWPGKILTWPIESIRAWSQFCDEREVVPLERFFTFKWEKGFQYVFNYVFINDDDKTIVCLKAYIFKCFLFIFFERVAHHPETEVTEFTILARKQTELWREVSCYSSSWSDSSVNVLR